MFLNAPLCNTAKFCCLLFCVRYMDIFFPEQYLNDTATRYLRLALLWNTRYRATPAFSGGQNRTGVFLCCLSVIAGPGAGPRAGAFTPPRHLVQHRENVNGYFQNQLRSFLQRPKRFSQDTIMLFDIKSLLCLPE